MDARLWKLRAKAALHTKCRLDPPISLKEVEAVEARYGFKLPDAYREFITKIGNGGTLPPLNPQADAGPSRLLPFQDSTALEKVRLDFPLSESWEWDTDPDFSSDTPEDEEKLACVRENGVLFLTNEAFDGGQDYFLIVSGPRRGEVWEQDEHGALQLPGCTFWDWMEYALSQKLAAYTDRLFQQEREKQKTDSPLSRIRRLMAGKKRQSIRWNPPAPLDAVRDFERRHGITLPAEYVTFITEIADGCQNYPSVNSKGMGGTMFSLNELDSVLHMAEPFPFQEPNDEALQATLLSHNRQCPLWQTDFADLPQEDPISPVWASPAYSVLRGALPFAINNDTGTFGNHTQVLLVLNGPSAGQVWKAKKFTLQPPTSQFTFFDWLLNTLKNGDI